jgi:predicted kinase
MIVPLAAGGPNDTIGRILAERMRAPLGQPVIIENVVGANGTIGVGRAVRAAPDGYTLSIGGFNSHVVNGAVYALAYDVLTDFEPVALLSSSGGGLIVARKTMPADDLKGLIAWLRANPGTATAGIRGAVRLAPDEWMARIVGDGWDHERREAVEKVQWALAQRLLTLGLNVALENGFWRRTERQAYRARASELGADSKLIDCDVRRDELKRRLVARNADLRSDTFVVTREQLDEMWPHFEPPGEDELQ